MKPLLACLLALFTAVLVSGCAQGGGGGSAGSGSISMYGTIDEGVTFHK